MKPLKENNGIENYRSCTLDCAAALALNPSNVKAYYRSARALLALDKLSQAHDAATRGLALDPSNTALQQLANSITTRQSTLDELARQRAAQQERERRIQQTLTAALSARNIVITPSSTTSSDGPDLEDAQVRLEPDALSPESEVVFPCVLLYPVDAQSDFIKSFAETQSVGEHLEYIFPLPWDQDGEYTLESVECYMQTGTGGLVKVGKKMSLLRVLSGMAANSKGGKVEVLDGLVRIFVVPAKKSKAWIEEMKRRMKR